MQSEAGAAAAAEEIVQLSESERGRGDLMEDANMRKLASLLGIDSHEVRSKVLLALKNLCETINGRYRVVEHGMVQIIVDMAERSEASLDLQRLCLHIIRGLSLIEFGREALVQHSTVRILVGLINSTDDEIRCSALRATFNLSVVNVRIRQAIVEAGALPHLIEAAQEPSDGQCAAVGTLANLATESDIKRAIVRQYNGLKPLLRLLTANDTSILTHACRALFAIAANDENKLAITREGGLPLLLDCMNSVCDAVRMNAAGALANLAIHPVNKLKLVERGALGHLRNLAYSNNCKIQRQVARCLFALAAHVENRKAILDERCLTALVHLLRSNNFDVQVNAAGAIGNIAMTDEFKKPVVNSGALVRLIALASMPDTRVQRQAARAIFTLTAKEFSKRKLASHNGLPALIRLTESRNEDIQRDAAGALANMAIGSENKDRIVELGGLQPLIALLKSPAVAVQRQSARAIFALAGNASNQASILEAGGLEPLIELLSSKNDEVQKHASGAIANMANRHPDRVIGGGALPLLVHIVLNHHSLEVRRQAARAVFNLTPPGKRRGQMILTPYAGIAGEQQRVRHEMRALFEIVLQSQPLRDLKELGDEIDEEKKAFPDLDCSGSLMELNSRPTSSSSSSSSNKSFSNRGRKRSCDNLLDSFRSNFARRKINGAPQRSGIDHDLLVSVPVFVEPNDDGNDGGNCNCTFPRRKREMSTASMDFEEDDAVEVEEKMEDLTGNETNESAPISVTTSEKPSCMCRRHDGKVKYFEFSGHAAILTARCKLFQALVENLLWDLRQDAKREQQHLEENNNMLHIVVSRKYTCQFQETWLTLFEYLYTDSVRRHAGTLRSSSDLATEVATLSYSLEVPRLGCFCTELNPLIREMLDYPATSPFGQKVRESTWVKDMSRMLRAQEVQLLPDFSDVDLVVFNNSSQQQQQYEAQQQQQQLIQTPSEGRVEEEAKEEEDAPCVTLQEQHRITKLEDEIGRLSPKRIKTDFASHQPAGAHLRREKIFPAHRVILASRCPFFKAQFGSAVWKDSFADTVKFMGTEEALKVVIRYLYCGVDSEVLNTLENKPSTTLQVLVIANEYNLDGLMSQCESALINWINDSTVFVLLQELEYVHAPLLRSLCLLFLLSERLCCHIRRPIKVSPQKIFLLRDESGMYRYIDLQEPDAPEDFKRELAKEIETTGMKWGFIEGLRRSSSSKKMKQQHITDFFTSAAVPMDVETQTT